MDYVVSSSDLVAKNNYVVKNDDANVASDHYFVVVGFDWCFYKESLSSFFRERLGLGEFNHLGSLLERGWVALFFLAPGSFLCLFWPFQPSSRCCP